MMATCGIFYPVMKGKETTGLGQFLEAGKFFCELELPCMTDSSSFGAGPSPLWARTSRFQTPGAASARNAADTKFIRYPTST